jgi:uncharacterized protein
MSRSVVALALATLVTLTPQTPPATAQTPPPTTSRDCPNTGADTTAFLSGPMVEGRAPGGTLQLAVVNDDDSRDRGLMCVTRIPPGRGMIFVFAPPDGRRDFWMKDTLVALDMVFAHADGVVDVVAANVPATKYGTPDDKVARRSGVGRFVIELGAGDAARLGIKNGTKLALPTLEAKD